MREIGPHDRSRRVAFRDRDRSRRVDHERGVQIGRHVGKLFRERDLDAGGLLVPMWREIAGMAYLWRVPHALDGTHLEHTLGPLYSTPLSEALRASLRRLGFGSVEPAPA